ncbi:penicillin acylase family protein [Hellea balneolensis]|uniref:penicillin acylase family protein n=1 Tax=Hellea balneolensis TaxID=287478 RepID=UPI00040B0665|nr:penicillin acylase family protein [Hellea balneolensis]
MRNFLKSAGVLAIVAAVGGLLYLKTPSSSAPDAESIRDIAAKYDARIIRDEWGVPHIFGKTDADASFGFGYAHAEDDWKHIQESVMGARGMTAQYKGKESAPQDYLYDLFKVREAVEAKYETDLKPETRAIVEGYVAAINLYGIEHPEKVAPGILPVTKHDVIAGYTWMTPFFYRLDGKLEELFTDENKPTVSPWQQQSSLNLPEAVRGSNGFAVAPSRSDDRHTRLIVNSHQPMNGLYAWYEAHMVSEEGLNIAGASFPGTPILAQGVTPDLGWTHTVNQPDLVDVYVLETHRDKKPTQYRLDGEWRDFEITKSKFRVKLFGPFSLPITRDVLWSEHGPVLETPSGFYAIRFAGLQEVRAVEQWYEMGKAANMQEWREALEQNGVLSFNITYADKEGNIGEVYNARMPKRIEGPDWSKALPGDQSKLIWQDYREVSELPQIWNPDCGWLFSANATPFKITSAECNNSREDFSETMGLEPRMTNRARRALELFEPDMTITEDELLRYRSDTRYHPQSAIMQMVVQLVATPSDDPLIKEAQEVLRNWDGDTTKENRGAALAIITGTRALGYEYIKPEADPMEMVKKTASELMEKYGRLDPEWGEINRLQRGEVDVPLDGGPDILRAIYADRDGISKEGTMNAFAGDTHIMYADWDESGKLTLESIHQYGAATLDESSPHYDDQAPLFARGEYKLMPMTLEEVLPKAKRDYRPGK